MEKFKVGPKTENHTVLKRDRSEVSKLNTDMHFRKPSPTEQRIIFHRK